MARGWGPFFCYATILNDSQLRLQSAMHHHIASIRRQLASCVHVQSTGTVQLYQCALETSLYCTAVVQEHCTTVACCSERQPQPCSGKASRRGLLHRTQSRSAAAAGAAVAAAETGAATGAATAVAAAAAPAATTGGGHRRGRWRRGRRRHGGGVGGGGGGRVGGGFMLRPACPQPWPNSLSIARYLA